MITKSKLSFLVAITAACGQEFAVDQNPGGGAPPAQREDGFVGLSPVLTSTVTAGEALVAECHRVDAEGRRTFLEDDETPPLLEVSPASAVVRSEVEIVAITAGVLDVRCVAPGSGLPPGPTKRVRVLPAEVALTRATVQRLSAVAGEVFEVACEAFDELGNRVPHVDFDVRTAGELAESTKVEGEDIFQVRLTRSDEVRVTCDAAGATTAISDVIFIESGPPAVVRLNGPTASAIDAPIVDQVFSWVPVIQDAFGNVVDGVDARIERVTPENAAQVLGELNIVPLRSGAATLDIVVERGRRAWTDFETFRSTVDVLLGPPPGAPRCLDPQDASMVNHLPGTPYLFFAQFFDVPAGARTFIADQEVAVAPDGTAEATIDTVEGLNIVQMRVEEDGVVTQRRLCAFHASDRWLSPDAAGRPSRLPHGLTVGIHEAALNDDDASDLDSLVDFTRGAADSVEVREKLDEILRNALPTLDICLRDACRNGYRIAYGNDSDRDWRNGLIFEELTALDVDFVAPQNGRPGRIDFDFGLGDIGVRGTVERLQQFENGERTEQLLEFEALWEGLDAGLSLDVELVQGLPSVAVSDVRIPRFGNASVSVAGLGRRVQVALDDWIYDSAEPLIRTGLEEALKPIARVAFRDLYVGARTELEAALEQGLVFETLDGRELALDGLARFDRLAVSDDDLVSGKGLGFVFTPAVEPTGTDRGLLLAKAIGPSAPGHDADQPLASVARVGALNQTFDALWRLGLFELALSTEELPANIPDFPFTGALQVNLRLAPVVTIDAEDRLKLAFGPLDVRTNADILGEREEATLRFAAEVSLAPEISGDRLVLSAPSVDRVWFNVQGVPVVSAVEAQLEEGARVLGGYLIERLLGEAWSAPPFPSFGPPDALIGYGYQATDRFGATSLQLDVTDELRVRGAVGELP